MPRSRKLVLLGAVGLAGLCALAIAIATSGGPLPPAQDLSTDLANAFNAAQSGELKLEKKVSVTVLAANGVPERNAPSFKPRLIDAVGAVRFTALGRPAVLVEYEGKNEGRFAVVSVGGKLDDISGDSGVIEHMNRRYTTFLRPGPGGAPLHGVGQSQAGRLVYVVGTQPMEKLAELADMIPLP